MKIKKKKLKIYKYFPIKNGYWNSLTIITYISEYILNSFDINNNKND